MWESLEREGARRLSAGGTAVAFALVLLTASASAFVAASRTGPAADLRVQSASSSLSVDGGLDVALSVRNAGRRRTPASQAAVAWRRDGTARFVELGRSSAPALKPGASRRLSMHLDLPAGAAPGSYRIRVCADAGSRVREMSERNNCRAAGAVALRGPQLPAGPAPGPPVTIPTEPAPSPSATAAPSPEPIASPSPTPPPDQTPPDTTLTATPVALDNHSRGSFSFESSESGSTFQCRTDDAAWAECASPAVVSGLADGGHTFAVRATDAVGNTDPTPATSAWTIDTTPPAVTVTDAPEVREPVGPVEVAFVIGEAGATSECRLDDGAWAPCASPVQLNIPAAGTHALAIRATDPAGNASAPVTVAWRSVAPRKELCGTLAEGATLSPDEASLYVITCEVTVPAGTTLELAPGTVVKAAERSSLRVFGTLLARGSAEQPAIFTSLTDDSIAGDSNTDAGATQPKAGDWGGIKVAAAGAKVDLSRAQVRFAYFGLTGQDGEMIVDHVTLSDNVQGIHVGTAVNNDTLTKFAVTNSRVERATSTSIVYGSDGPAVPRIQNTTVVDQQNSLSPPIVVTSDRIDLDQLSGNRAHGGFRHGLSLNGTVIATSSLPTGIPVLIPHTLTIPAGVTVTAPAASIVKAGLDHGGNETMGTLRVLGTLLARGSAEQPAIFTSLTDDSIAGDSNTDAGATQPKAGDWGGIKVADAATIDLSHTRIGYAYSAIDTQGPLRLDHVGVHDTHQAVTVSQAAPEETEISNSRIERTAGTAVAFIGHVARLSELHVSDATHGLIVQQGHVAFRGAFVDVDHAIRACNWATHCSVDAAHTFWGDATGPARTSPDGLPAACGAVLVDQWRADHASQETTDGELFASPNCDRRPTPQQALLAAESGAQRRLASMQAACDDGDDKVCADLAEYWDCFNRVKNEVTENQGWDTWDTAATVVAVAALAFPPTAPAAAAAAIVVTGVDLIFLARDFHAIAEAYEGCFDSALN